MPSASTPEATLDLWGANLDEVAGFVQGGRAQGLPLFPTLAAYATPSGPVTDAALDALTADLITRLRAIPQLDGILIALHGAMVTPFHPHADAEIMRRVRQAVGAAIPIVLTHDFHANISPEIVELSTVLLTYKTCPHIDQLACGLQAARIMAGILRGTVRPVQAIVKPDMVFNIRFQNTGVAPLAAILEEERRMEREPGVLAASVACGYQYADVPAMGPSAIVVTNNDPAQAQAFAQKLSDMLWAARSQLILDVPDAAAAVKQALASPASPVVLVEMGDNIGGGSAGDATIVLAELLRQQASGWAVALADPAAVQAAAALGVGGAFAMLVGGKTDKLHGDPVHIRGRVKTLYDGRFTETEIRHGGQRHHDQGLSAVIEVEGGSYLLLTTKRQMPFSLHQWTSAGILPERQKILVVKAAIAFRAAYEPIAAEIIEVDTPGVTAINPARFHWTRVPKTRFGMNP